MTNISWKKYTSLLGDKLFIYLKLHENKSEEFIISRFQYTHKNNTNAKPHRHIGSSPIASMFVTHKASNIASDAFIVNKYQQMHVSCHGPFP